MQDVIWKSFKLGELFNRSTKLAISINQKDLTLSSKNEGNDIALISASRNGNGRVGYIKLAEVNKEKISINKITYDDQWGFTFFQNEPFVITGGHNAILEIKSDSFKNLLDKHLFCYSFLSNIINKITIKSHLFGYGYKINNKFDKEIILLPCLEVSKEDNYIWEEDNHYYTLAIDYIKKLMDLAKEEREKKTIRLYEAERAKYEAERAKYEAERAKYEADYHVERRVLVWKSFKLGELFNYTSKHIIKNAIKSLKVYDEYKEGRVAIVTASAINNGIIGYTEETQEIKSKKIKDVLTIAPDGSAGICFYQSNYIVSTGHNKLIEVKNEKIKKVLDENKHIYYFLAKLLSKNFYETFYGFSKSITENDFNKTIILLPCLEVSKEDNYIWEEDNHYYTLATNYISYIYLSGRVNYNQRLINQYTYNY